MSIQIGCCLPAGRFRPGDTGELTPAERLCDGYAFLKESGYDYAEISTGLVMPLEDEEYERLLKYHAQGSFTAAAANGFIPGNLSLYDPDCRAALEAHVEKAVGRLCGLGVSVIVFGSGAARRMPENDRERHREELCGFLRMCDLTAGRYGAKIAIEPLRSAECNILNTVSETGALCRELGLPNVKLLADVFHMDAEGEDLAGALRDNADMLVHVHVAECPSREAPSGSAGDVLRSFAKELAAIGYSGGATLEAGMPDFASCAAGAVGPLREIFPA